MNKQQFYLIAVHPADAAKSRFLGAADTANAEELLARFDVQEFVGGGYEISLCRELSLLSYESDESGKSNESNELDELDYRLSVDNVQRRFAPVELVLSLPFIEGELAPGVYEFENFDFYEICDALAFSKVLTDTDADGFFVLDFRLVCEPGGVKFRSLDADKDFFTAKCHSFEFFDLFCPFCNAQLFAKAKIEQGPACHYAERAKCSHYVGNALLCSETYEKGPLDDLAFPHKFVGEELYFEVSPSNWKKALIYVLPAEQFDSFWSSTEDGYYENRFFFVSPES